jgi:hypothetical protein
MFFFGRSFRPTHLESDLSRTADVSLKIYLRSEASSGISGKNDPYMRSIKIKPEFSNFSKLIGTTCYAYLIRNTKTAVTEYLRSMVRPRRWNRPDPDQFTSDPRLYAYLLPSLDADAATDMWFLFSCMNLSQSTRLSYSKVIGRSSFGKVIQVRKRDTGRI